MIGYRTVIITSMSYSAAGMFESLSKSKKVWVSDSGSLYDVIIDEVNIEEQDVEGVFLVTVQYHYSLYDK